MKTLEEIKVYLPKHKLDNFYMEELNGLSDEELSLVLEELLIWIKNMNFLISVEIADLLSKRPKLVEKTFLKHLRDPKIESVYKYNLIAQIIKNFSKEDQQVYQDELTRLANEPTKEEKYAEVNLIAKSLL